MTEMIALSNTVLAYGGLAMMGASAVFVFDYYTSKSLAPFIRRFGLHLAFLVTLCAMTLTLVYSEIFGFVPCGLCWSQRIFMFPQLFLTGAALYFRDALVARYGIVLSIPGLLFALYQHYLQMGGSEFIVCPTSGGGDCAERILFAFGFMTFPLLAASLFIFLIVLYAYYLSATKKVS